MPATAPPAAGIFAACRANAGAPLPGRMPQGACIGLPIGIHQLEPEIQQNKQGADEQQDQADSQQPAQCIVEAFVQPPHRFDPSSRRGQRRPIVGQARGLANPARRGGQPATLSPIHRPRPRGPTPGLGRGQPGAPAKSGFEPANGRPASVPRREISDPEQERLRRRLIRGNAGCAGQIAGANYCQLRLRRSWRFLRSLVRRSSTRRSAVASPIPAFLCWSKLATPLRRSGLSRRSGPSRCEAAWSLSKDF